MNTDTVLCFVEIFGALFIVAAATIILRWASLRQSLRQIGQTTRDARSQWTSILTGVLGANLGYVIFIGVYSLVDQSTHMDEVEAFLIPATIATYLICAFPIYLPVGVITGILIQRTAQRKAIGSRTSLILTLLIAMFIGVVIAIPIYMVGLIAAAL